MGVLEQIKTLVPGIDEKTAVFFLRAAADEIKNFCNVESVPDGLLGLQIEMAIRKYNRIGNEGETSRSQGDISRSFTVEGITDADKRRMYPFRRMRL